MSKSKLTANFIVTHETNIPIKFHIQTHANGHDETLNKVIKI